MVCSTALQYLIQLKSDDTIIVLYGPHFDENTMASPNGSIFRVTVTGEFATQRPVTGSFDVFFDLRLNKRLSKQ